MLRTNLQHPKPRASHGVAAYRGTSVIALIALFTALGAARAQEQAAAPAPEFDPEEVAKVLRQALDNEPRQGAATAKPLQQWSTPGFDWKRTANPDGTAYTAKRTLSGDWNGNVGADVGVHDVSRAPGDPDWRPLQAPAGNTGAAWANVQVPGVASFDARLGAGDAPSTKFGVSRTLPLGGVTSLTLQDSYIRTETAAAATPPGLPAKTPVWSNERQVKLNVLPTGTALGAGATSSSIDGATHHSLSAEQKLFDKFNVTTKFNDVGEPTSSRSITAGFKTSW